MNLDEFSYVADDRRYINPQVGLDESNAFIDNLRNTQAQRTEEIAQDTYNLGTAIPSNLGGLGGAGSYFTARYQTPQTNAIIGDLKATAQAQALSEAMNNELAKAKQRYTNAYKAAQRRAVAPPSGGDPTTNGDVDFVTPGEEYGLQYERSEGGLSSGVDGSANTRLFEVRTKDGRRIPLNIIGAGDSITVDTPTYSFSGKDKAREYAQNALRNGGKILHYQDNGEAVDVSNGYAFLWGL